MATIDLETLSQTADTLLQEKESFARTGSFAKKNYLIFFYQKPFSYLSFHYAPETFKMCSYGLTLLKLNNSTATQILREIQFWQIEASKSAIFGNFRGSELGY